MVKDSFPHDADALNDPKMQPLVAAHGMAGYGRWWVLVEKMRQQPGHVFARTEMMYEGLSKCLMLDVFSVEAFIEDLISYDLLQCSDTTFWSESLLRRMKLKTNKTAREPRDKAKLGFKSWTLEDFRQALKPYLNQKKIPVQDLKDFYDYWRETSSNGKLMRFQKEDTWDLNLRLQRWMRNKDMKAAGGRTPVVQLPAVSREAKAAQWEERLAK